MKLLRPFIVAALTLPAVVVSSQPPPDQRVVVRPGKAQGPVWLGVRLGKADEARGTEILGVMRRSPGAAAGLRPGDRLLDVDGTPIENLRDLLRVLRPYRPGDEIEVVTSRDGKRTTSTVKLTEKPDDESITSRHLLGHPAPSLRFRYAGDGQEGTLDELKGKPTVLEFWATWCAPCRYVQKDLEAVKGELSDQIHIVGVSSEPLATVQQYLARSPVKYAMAVADDAQLGEYLVQSLPTVVILDEDHRVAAVVFGRGNRATIEAKLKSLLDR